MKRTCKRKKKNKTGRKSVEFKIFKNVKNMFFIWKTGNILMIPVMKYPIKKEKKK